MEKLAVENHNLISHPQTKQTADDRRDRNDHEREFEVMPSDLARRVAECLAKDSELPLLSFSFGVACSPNDGRTFDQILSKADVALYEMKRSNTRKLAASQGSSS